MSQHHDAHSGGGGPQWLENHLGGLVMPFGERFERFLDRIMYLLVNDFFRKAAVLYMAVFTPLLLVEYVVRLAHS